MRISKFIDEMFERQEINCDSVHIISNMYKEMRELDTKEKRAARMKADRERRTRRKLKAIEYKGGVCVDCGESFHHAAMEFHHCDPTQKDFMISQSFRMKWADVKKELDKCSLLCANCHRIRHYDMRQGVA